MAVFEINGNGGGGSGIQVDEGTFTLTTGTYTKSDLPFKPDFLIVYNVKENGSAWQNNTMLCVYDDIGLSNNAVYFSRIYNNTAGVNRNTIPNTLNNGILDITSNGFSIKNTDYTGNSTFRYIAIKF